MTTLTDQNDTETGDGTTAGPRSRQDRRPPQPVLVTAPHGPRSRPSALDSSLPQRFAGRQGSPGACRTAVSGAVDNLRTDGERVKIQTLAQCGYSSPTSCFLADRDSTHADARISAGSRSRRDMWTHKLVWTRTHMHARERTLAHAKKQ